MSASVAIVHMNDGNVRAAWEAFAAGAVRVKSHTDSGARGYLHPYCVDGGLGLVGTFDRQSKPLRLQLPLRSGRDEKLSIGAIRGLDFVMFESCGKGGGVAR